jgi:hypothetical protein
MKRTRGTWPRRLVRPRRNSSPHTTRIRAAWHSDPGSCMRRDLNQKTSHTPKGSPLQSRGATRARCEGRWGASSRRTIAGSGPRARCPVLLARQRAEREACGRRPSKCGVPVRRSSHGQSVWRAPVARASHGQASCRARPSEQRAPVARASHGQSNCRARPSEQRAPVARASHGQSNCRARLSVSRAPVARASRGQSEHRAPLSEQRAPAG